ncbi:hypothetical protein WJX73_004738 [Symbiochloris irregularis]|uniref:shikimate kinase n=1 Tax=Symbiochloris irregularis TaxID=706552 RepID=A0AAW1PRZ0_9CHLO
MLLSAPGGPLSRTRQPAQSCTLLVCPENSAAHRTVQLRRSHGQRRQRGALHRQHRLLCRAQEAQSATSPAETTVDAVDELMDRVQELAGPVKEGLEGTSVYLVGMMGSGKTSTGKLLARMLGYPFLDSDVLIENLSKKSIANIFEEDGERYFRDLETSVLRELMPWKSCIVATGGGAVVSRDNWELMQHAVVVWLHGNAATLTHRTIADGTASRPLLGSSAHGGETGGDYDATHQRINKLLTERATMYAQADLCVPIDSNEPNRIAGASAAEVVYRVLKGLDVKLKHAKMDREQKKNFYIESVSGFPNANFLEPPDTTPSAKKGF